MISESDSEEERSYVREIVRFVKSEKFYSSSSESESSDEDSPVQKKRTKKRILSSSDDSDTCTKNATESYQQYRKSSIESSDAEDSPAPGPSGKCHSLVSTFHSSGEDSSEFPPKGGRNNQAVRTLKLSSGSDKEDIAKHAAFFVEEDKYFSLKKSTKQSGSTSGESTRSRENSERKISGKAFIRGSDYYRSDQKKSAKRRRRSNKGEESDRVAEGVRRAKERSLNRTNCGLVEWRAGKTFGLSDVRSQPTSQAQSHSNFQVDKEKMVRISATTNYGQSDCERNDPSRKRIRLNDMNVSHLWQEVERTFSHILQKKGDRSLYKGKSSDSEAGSSGGASDLRRFRIESDTRFPARKDNYNRNYPNLAAKVRTGAPGAERAERTFSASSTATSKSHLEVPNSTLGTALRIPPLGNRKGGKEQDEDEDPELKLMDFASSQNLSRSDSGSYSPPSSFNIKITTPSKRPREACISPVPGSSAPEKSPQLLNNKTDNRLLDTLKDSSFIPKSPWSIGEEKRSQLGFKSVTPFSAPAPAPAPAAVPYLISSLDLLSHLTPGSAPELMISSSNSFLELTPGSAPDPTGEFTAYPITDAITGPITDPTTVPTHDRTTVPFTDPTSDRITVPTIDHSSKPNETPASDTDQTLVFDVDPLSVSGIDSTPALALDLDSTPNYDRVICPTMVVARTLTQTPPRTLTAVMVPVPMCVPVEQYIEFTDMSTAYLTIDGKTYTTSLQQWQNILK